jgi:hypothetical protein
VFDENGQFRVVAVLTGSKTGVANAAFPSAYGMPVSTAHDGAAYPGAMRAEAAVLAARGDSGDSTVPYGLATMYVHLGEKDRALKWLERGFDGGEPTVRFWLGMPTFDIFARRASVYTFDAADEPTQTTGLSSVKPGLATARIK